jgi:hypothetical protein
MQFGTTIAYMMNAKTKVATTRAVANLYEVFAMASNEPAQAGRVDDVRLPTEA